MFRKNNHKDLQKRFHTHYGLGSHSLIDDWDFIILGQCDPNEQLKENFDNIDGKPFTQQVQVERRSTYINTRT